MKRFISSAIVVTAALGLAAPTFAADTKTLTVQASVLGVCKFKTATGATLDFGVLDPSVGSDKPASTSVLYWCTKNVPSPSVAANNGANWDGSKRNMLDTVSGDQIPYTLTLTPSGTPNGPGTDLTLTVDGNVLGADYLAKSAGNYSDTVTLSVSP